MKNQITIHSVQADCAGEDFGEPKMFSDPQAEEAHCAEIIRKHGSKAAKAALEAGDLDEAWYLLNAQSQFGDYFYRRDGEVPLPEKLDIEIHPPCGSTPPLPCTLNTQQGWLRSEGYAKDSAATFDWYKNKLQILVFDGQDDDPALHVRLNPDGTIAEVLVRNRELLDKVVVEDEAHVISDWEKERDADPDRRWEYGLTSDPSNNPKL